MQTWHVELIRLAASAGFALMFGLSGWEKLSRPLWFRLVLKGYGLLPRNLIRPMSRVLPAVELMIAAALLTDLLWPLPMLATAGLLVGFTAAMAVNLRRGNSYIICGCFGHNSERTLSWGLVRRNLGLTILALAVAQVPVLLPSYDPQVLLLHAATVVGVALVAASFKLVSRISRMPRGRVRPR